MGAYRTQSILPGSPGGKTVGVYCITKVLRSDQCSELAKLDANVSLAKATFSVTHAANDKAAKDLQCEYTTGYPGMS
jgi:hypothetical protein